MAYQENSGARAALAVGDQCRIEYRGGAVYVTTGGVTVQISPEAFFDLAGAMMLACRRYRELTLSWEDRG